MIDQRAARLAHERDRWMRPDAQRIMRPDAARWIRPDIARYLLPGTDPSDVFPALDRKFNPNQPRIPAGQTGGGRWTDGGDLGADISGEALQPAEPSVSEVPADANSALAFQAQSAGDLTSWLKQLDDLAWNDPRPIPNAEATDVQDNLEEVQGRRPPLSTWFPGASTSQQTRLELATVRSGNALAEIRRYDESWKPREQSYSASLGSIEGAIARAEARAAEAEAYLNQRRSGIGGNLGPPLDPSRTSGRPQVGPCDGESWINSYRAINNAPDLFGRPVWPKGADTVAVAELDGHIYFGVSSNAPGYSTADRQFALNWRGLLAAEHSEFRTRNRGSIPNDAFFHAEENLLIRADRYLDGLRDRSFEVQVDNDVCESCRKVLPKLGVELGNPYVVFSEIHSGKKSAMWNGIWLRWRHK